MWRLALLCVFLSWSVFAGEPLQFVSPAADPVHNLTGHEFLKDVAYNFGALFSTHTIVPLAAGTAAVGISTAPEQQLEQHFARGDMWGPWGHPGAYIGHPLLLAGVSGSLFVVSRKSESSRFRSLSYSLVHGSIMTATIVQSTKPMFHRLRPSGEDHLSFPSGHAADSFMFATVFAEHYGWKAALPGYAIAAYVAASRLEERKHHLTDVAAGAAIGYLAGKTVTRRIIGGERSRFGWQIQPSRRGFTASLRVALP